MGNDHEILRCRLTWGSTLPQDRRLSPDPPRPPGPGTPPPRPPRPGRLVRVPAPRDRLRPCSFERFIPDVNVPVPVDTANYATVGVFALSDGIDASGVVHLFGEVRQTSCYPRTHDREASSGNVRDQALLRFLSQNSIGMAGLVRPVDALTPSDPGPTRRTPGGPWVGTRSAGNVWPSFRS
jgi:hypothetical protein